MFDLVTWYWREVYWDLAGPFRGPFHRRSIVRGHRCKGLLRSIPRCVPPKRQLGFPLEEDPGALTKRSGGRASDEQTSLGQKQTASSQRRAVSLSAPVSGLSVKREHRASATDSTPDRHMAMSRHVTSSC